MKKCRNCGKEYSEGVYCPFCATPFEANDESEALESKCICPLCGAAMDYHIRFCNQCGSPMQNLATYSPPNADELKNDEPISPTSNAATTTEPNVNTPAETNAATPDATKSEAPDIPDVDAASEVLGIPKPDYEPIAVRKPYPLQKPTDDLAIDVHKHVRLRRFAAAMGVLAVAAAEAPLSMYCCKVRAVSVSLLIVLVSIAAYLIFSTVIPKQFPIARIYKKHYLVARILVLALLLALVAAYAAIFILMLIPSGMPLNSTVMVVCCVFSAATLLIGLAALAYAKHQVIGLTIAIYGIKNPTKPEPRIPLKTIFSEYYIFEEERDKYNDYLRRKAQYNFEHKKGKKTRTAKGLSFFIYRHRAQILIVIVALAALAATIAFTVISLTN